MCLYGQTRSCSVCLRFFGRGSDILHHLTSAHLKHLGPLRRGRLATLLFHSSVEASSIFPDQTFCTMLFARPLYTPVALQLLAHRLAPVESPADLFNHLL